MGKKTRCSVLWAEDTEKRRRERSRRGATVVTITESNRRAFWYCSVLAGLDFHYGEGLFKYVGESLIYNISQLLVNSTLLGNPQALCG